MSANLYGFRSYDRERAGRTLAVLRELSEAVSGPREAIDRLERVLASIPSGTPEVGLEAEREALAAFDETVARAFDSGWTGKRIRALFEGALFPGGEDR